MISEVMDSHGLEPVMNGMRSKWDTQLEYELTEAETAGEGDALTPESPTHLIQATTRCERSLWQQAATGGKLCRLRQWRWSGRFEACDLLLHCLRCRR